MNQVQFDNAIAFTLLKLAEDIKAMPIDVQTNSAAHLSNSFFMGFRAGVNETKLSMIKLILGATKEVVL